jgi:hypothetical protein
MIQDLEFILKFIAIVGGLLTVLKIVYEFKEGRKQKALDLRWRKANAARQMITNFISSEQASNAITMFDWSDREFEVEEGTFESISFEDVRMALRTDNLSFSDKEVFIRDCIDGFLFQVEFLEQAIRNGLIDFDDIKFPTRYYNQILVKHEIYVPLMRFAKEYDYANSLGFFQRFK